MIPLKQRYINPSTLEIAYFTKDQRNLVVRKKYGTRIIPSGPDKVSAEHYLLKYGFKKEKMWKCTAPTCPAVQRGDPCYFVRDDDPSGECLAHPKDARPDLPHHLVTYAPA